MRSNKELTNKEFIISQSIKRAMVSLNMGDYYNAEMNLHTALQDLMLLDNRSKCVAPAIATKLL